MTPAAIYALLAILGTLFYGLGCFQIFGDAEIPLAHRIHQHWFNTAGAAIGWLAGWPVFNEWFVLGSAPTFATIALLVIAFIGVTGHLPLTTMTLLQRKQFNGRVWPSERP
jgi:hypothetical protein